MPHDLNRCEFIGRLGKDPEIRFLPAGDAVANFSIAVGKSWKDKASGDKKEETTWVPLTIFGKLAEVAGEYLKKGAQIYAAGEFHVRKYQDKQGNDRYVTEIRVERFQMLGTKQKDADASSGSEPKRTLQTAGVSGDDEEIPF